MQGVVDDRFEAVRETARTTGEALAANAAAIDAGTLDVHASYKIIKESGLLAALVPSSAGGAGLSFVDHTKVLEELATGDGALALGFNMHNVAIGSLCESAGLPLPERAERFRDWVFDEVVRHQKMFASATSEPGSGAKLRQLSTTYAPSGDEYVLTGEKAFVSLAGVADYYVVAAVPDFSERDEPSPDEVSHFVVARDDPGVTFGGVWDGAALRGTETATMRLDRVTVPRDRLFLGVEGVSLFKLVREPHWMVSGYMGAYLGIAESILRFVTGTVGGDPKRRDSAVCQAEVGKLAADLDAARALVYSAARLIDERRGTLEANTAAHSAKYVVGEVAPRLALGATRICGSAALKRSRPLERLLRESAFCAVMPAKADECLDYVGKSVLGFNMFHAHTVEW